MKYIILVVFIMLSGCQNSKDKLLETDKSQVNTRSYQTKSFDGISREELLQAAIATMQDLGFVIMHGDYNLGLVSANRPSHRTKMTVTARAKNKNIMLLRVSAQKRNREISEPEFYKNFFLVLRKSLFIEKNNTNSEN